MLKLMAEYICPVTKETIKDRIYMYKISEHSNFGWQVEITECFSCGETHYFNQSLDEEP